MNFRLEGQEQQNVWPGLNSLKIMIFVFLSAIPGEFSVLVRKPWASENTVLDTPTGERWEVVHQLVYFLHRFYSFLCPDVYFCMYRRDRANGE